MQNKNPNNFYQEDEIKLNEIINRLIASKKIIIITTLIFTLIATYYGYVKTPSYQANSVIKIGFYTNKDNNKVPIMTLSEVIQELNMRFIELPKHSDMSNLSSIDSIGLVKQKQDFQYIILRSIGETPDEAIKKIEIAQQYLINSHQKKLDEEIERIKFFKDLAEKQVTTRQDDLDLLKIKNSNKIYEIERRIAEDYEKLEFTKQNIVIQERYLDLYKLQINEIETEMPTIEATNPTLAAIRSIEKRDLGALIADETLTLNQMNNAKKSLEIEIQDKEKLTVKSKNNVFFREMANQERVLEKRVQDKLNEVAELKRITQERSYSNTKVFTEIKSINEIKIIRFILLGFITGLIISILIVFLKQVFRQKEIKNTQ